jgi:hypothetical protein
LRGREKNIKAKESDLSFHSNRPQPGRSSGARNRARLQDRPPPVRGHSSRVDAGDDTEKWSSEIGAARRVIERKREEHKSEGIRFVVCSRVDAEVRYLSETTNLIPSLLCSSLFLSITLLVLRPQVRQAFGF